MLFFFTLESQDNECYTDIVISEDCRSCVKIHNYSVNIDYDNNHSDHFPQLILVT